MGTYCECGDVATRFYNDDGDELQEPCCDECWYFQLEQFDELFSSGALMPVPVIHWGLPQFEDLWDGKGMCGVECSPEHTSAGLAITCPDCLRLFKEQNAHLSKPSP